jgi:hypothetical protein
MYMQYKMLAAVCFAGLIFASAACLGQQLHCVRPTIQNSSLDSDVKAQIGKIGPLKAADADVKVKKATEDVLLRFPSEKPYIYTLMQFYMCDALNSDSSLTPPARSQLLQRRTTEVYQQVYGISVPTTSAAQVAKPAKQCKGDTTHVFSPQDPGVLQHNPDGSLVDLGDAGGGTRFHKWKYTWVAPATVTSVHCTTRRNEHVRAENMNGSEATCIGDINGGNDGIDMHVSWDGPCDRQ